MAETKPEDPGKAYGRERDPRAVKRTATAGAVCVPDCGISDAAGLPMQCPDRVSHRVRHSGEGGLLIRGLAHSAIRPASSILCFAAPPRRHPPPAS